MPETNRPLRLQPDDRLAFFRGFLKRPKQVGSIWTPAIALLAMVLPVTMLVFPQR